MESCHATNHHATSPAGDIRPMSRHPLRQGTWIRSNVAIGDSADFNEREAPPGAVGYIEYVEDHRSDGTHGFSYSIHFIPSGICNRFDDNEIDTQTDILNVEDPAIPHKTERDLYEAVANLYYKTKRDDDREVVFVTPEHRRLIDECFEASDALSERNRAPAVRLLFDVSKRVADLYAVSFGAVDTMAELSGVGDRLAAQVKVPTR